MNKLLSVLIAGLAFATMSAHAANPHRATPAVPAEPARHEAGKPAEPPKATPAIPAEPAPKADPSNKGKHMGADRGKKKGHDRD